MVYQAPGRPFIGKTLSRRSLLRRMAAAGAALTLAGPLPARTGEAQASTARATGELMPLDPLPALFAAMERHPLVALAERHFVQEWHDFITALLFHPHLPTTLTDTVVEFGNSLYQDVADRFILGDQQVARADLALIWRYLGWDAPVYEQFFRTVRAVNWMRPPGQRIRVILGAPGYDVTKVRSADPGFARWWNDPVDGYFAAVTERQVLARGRRALLIGGAGHILRGVQRDSDANHVNAVTELTQRHPGSTYVVDTLILPPGAQKDAEGERLRAAVKGWRRPSLATLRGTWLGALTQMVDGTWINWGAQRAVNAAAAHYDAQADAVLYLGPGEVLTASQADPAIFHWGAYPAQLRRLNPIVSHIDHQQEDLIQLSLKWAEAGPSWFDAFK